MGHKPRRTEPKGAKRAFERAQGLYHDRARGAPTVSSIGASFRLGEPLSPEDRAACIADLESGDVLRAQNAAMALAHDRSPEVLDALLEALGKGAATSVASNLLQFVDDPRVRPALVDALGQERADLVSNVAQAVGSAGGAGARDVLGRRLTKLLDDPRTFADAAFANWRARSAVAVAEALLRLDPEAIAPAEALVKLMDHPCERAHAESTAAGLLASTRYGYTEPALLLERALARRFEESPDAISFHALPSLLFGDSERVRAECERRLDDPDPKTRRTLWHLLTESGNGWAAFIAVRALSRWVIEPADAETLLFCIQLLGRLVPRELAERVIRERLANESPGIRESAIGALTNVEPALARKLSREALRDEPDPALRRRLETYARWAPPRRPAPRRRARGGAARERLR
jgi:hypothetical protein